MGLPERAARVTCPCPQHTHAHTHGTTLNVIVPAHSTSAHVLGPALSTSQHVVVPSLSVDPYELEPKHSASLHLGWRTERVHVLVPAHGTSLLVLVPARSAGPTMFVRVGDAGARPSHADDLSRVEALQRGVWDLQGFAQGRGPAAPENRTLRRPANDELLILRLKKARV